MTPSNHKKRPRLSFTNQVVLGVVLGVAWGVFVGEHAAGLEPVGTVYVRLLQMTILPYIMCSLILGFGKLTGREALRIIPRLAGVMLVFWVVGLTLVLLMPLAFPDRQSASFFKPSSLEPPPEINLVDIFVPANPFEALAASTVPAVVLFSILLGVAIMGIKGKEKLLDILEVLTQGMTRVTGIVVKTTPIGVFALAASAAGTMDVSDFARLQVYFVTYIGASMLLACLVFPALTLSVTKVGYIELIRRYKAALVTAFTTGNLFVALPLILESSKDLFEERGLANKGSTEYVDILVPVSFNFPNMGKLIALLFVLFGGWYVGTPIPGSEYPSFVVTGMITFFGGIDIALPFMLKLQDLPSELFNIYATTGVINGRFATLLACVELICITIIGTSLLTGTFKVQFHRLAVFGAVSVAAVVILIGGSRMVLERVVPESNEQVERIKAMTFDSPVKRTVYDEAGQVTRENAVKEEGLFDRLIGRKKKVLYVGYIPDRLPFSYFNASNDLVGLDVELVSDLAESLDCSIVFAPTSVTNLAGELAGRKIDLAISGIPVLEDALGLVAYCEPYLKQTMAILVANDRKQEFADPQKHGQGKNLRLAVVMPSPYVPLLRAKVPLAGIEEISSPRDFFEADEGSYDALFISAEAGSAWTLLYPDYTVVLPELPVHTYSTAFAISKQDSEFHEYLNNWMTIQKDQERIGALYDYWILGHPREEREPRWCVIRDVLNWVE